MIELIALMFMDVWFVRGVESINIFNLMDKFVSYVRLFSPVFSDFEHPPPDENGTTWMDSFAGSEIMFIYIHFQISNHPTAMPKSNIVLLHMASLQEEFTKWMWLLSTMALTAFSAVTNTE
jgi:hypothetical protein